MVIILWVFFFFFFSIIYDPERERESYLQAIWFIHIRLYTVVWLPATDNEHFSLDWKFDSLQFLIQRQTIDR